MEYFASMAMDIAKSDRKKSSCNSLHIAFLFTGKNKMFSLGVNNHYSSYKTVLHNNITIHAEMDSIFRYMRGSITSTKIERFHRKKFKIIVFRIVESGKITFSKPCLNCIQTMVKFGISRIYWSDYDGNIQSEKPIKLLNRGEGEFSSGDRPEIYDELRKEKINS